MSKEFMTAIKALRHAGDALRSAGDAMTNAGNALSSIADLFELRIDKPELKVDMILDANKAESETEDPEADITHTRADVKALCVSKSRAGHTDQVKALLKKFGTENLTGLKDDQLEAFYKEAEVIGNAG